MRCEACQGSGQIMMNWSSHLFDSEGSNSLFPCPTCHGTGITHCCDGDRINDKPELTDDS